MGILIAFLLTDRIQMGKTCPLLFPVIRFSQSPKHLNLILLVTSVLL